MKTSLLKYLLLIFFTLLVGCQKDNETFSDLIIEEQISFSIDFKDWQKTLSPEEHTILSYLIQGFKASKIAEILQLSYQTVKIIISKLKQMFLDYFRLEEFAYP